MESVKDSLEHLFSAPGKDGPSQAQVSRTLKEWRRKARADRRDAARFEYDAIVKKAKQIKPFEKRFEFIKNGIVEVRIERDERRKLKLLLKLGALSLGVDGRSGEKDLKPESHAVGDPDEAGEATGKAAKEKKVMNTKEVSQACGIPVNTMYKLTTEKAKEVGKAFLTITSGSSISQ